VKVKMILDGREVEAPRGSTVLEVARREGIDIPTLCYLEALEPYGVCRLCLVEVSGSLPRSLRISCAQQVQEGLVVETDTEKVVKNRRVLFELLLARSPDSNTLIDLAARYGVTETRFSVGETEDNCVRCGRCVRACRDLIGAYALCFAERGYDRRVTTDFERHSEYCIGCGTCAQVCPTGVTWMKDAGDERSIGVGNTVVALFKLRKCSLCGTPYAPQKYLDFVQKNSDPGIGVDMERDLCPVCARKTRAEQMTGLWAEV
jgi:bidirectional [NiFe] hydrogenase diaphorase subunit